jgi:hypothetical protein
MYVARVVNSGKESYTMNNRIWAFFGMMLFAGSVAAQQSVLYSNPYDPTNPGNIAGGNCSFSTACGTYPGAFQLAQAFNLGTAATIQSVSFTVSDFNGPTPVEGAYGWAIFADISGLPSGPLGPVIADNQTVLPIASSGPGGVCLPYTGSCTTSYTSVNIAGPNPNPSGPEVWTNVVTLNTGAVNLGSGNYFLALYGAGPETQPEGLDAGYKNTGAIFGDYGAWSPINEGLAVTIKGTTAVPEINPSSAIGALTLLLGSLMVLRGRRGQTRVTAIA